VKILKGGRTGMQNRENPGTLNQNRQSRAVDLGSNGCRCVRVPWTTPCARCTGPRWTGRSKRRGMRSKPSARDLKVRTQASEGWRRRRRRAAARDRGSPALALDGVPGHHSDHELVQNEAGALAHVTGGSMGAIVPRRRPAPEGGGAATPTSSWVRCCARKEGKTGGD
jgi:hypothetical protein